MNLKLVMRCLPIQSQTLPRCNLHAPHQKFILEYICGPEDYSTHLMQLFSIFSLLPLLLLSITLLQSPSTHAIKFTLPAQRYPQSKCIWNPAHTNTLVIVTANVVPGPNQRVDVEIVDSSPKNNVYLAKKGISGEARLAITTHSEGEVGVCFRNHIEGGMFFIPLILSYN